MEGGSRKSKGGSENLFPSFRLPISAFPLPMDDVNSVAFSPDGSFKRGRLYGFAPPTNLPRKGGGKEPCVIALLYSTPLQKNYKRRECEICESLKSG